MSYQEALDTIQSFDGAIKAAAANRMQESIDPDATACNSAAAKILIAMSASLTAGVVGKITGTMDPGTAQALATAFFVGIPALPVFWISTHMGRLGSPVKYARLKKQLAAEQPLIELKESEFAQKEAKILKKAKPAIAVINSHLKYENRCVEYSNDSGREGFKIVDAKVLNQWEVEKLKAEKDKSLAALPSLETKSITA